MLGTVYYGRRGVEERHASRFATAFKGTVLSMSVQEIRFIRPNVAVEPDKARASTARQ